MSTRCQTPEAASRALDPLRSRILSLSAGLAALLIVPDLHAVESEDAVPGLRVGGGVLVPIVDAMSPPDMRSTAEIYQTSLAPALKDLKVDETIDLRNPQHQAVVRKIVAMYRKGGYEKVKALAKDGTMSAEHSKLVAEFRNAMVMETINAMAARFGEIRVNDFSTAKTAQSDIDHTFHKSRLRDPVTKQRIDVIDPVDGKTVVDGTFLKHEFPRQFKALHGIQPERMEVMSHAGEATIPDWREYPDHDTFVLKLFQGSKALGLNPEAYFLEGAYRRQVDRRSYESKEKLFRIHRARSTKARSARVLEHKADVSVERGYARTEVYRNVPPEWRKSYAFGATVGNLFFFQHHRGEGEIAERAKYLQRSMEDGMGSHALSKDGQGKLYFDLKKPERREMLRTAYKGAPGMTADRLDHVFEMYQTAESIRENREHMHEPAVRERVLKPMMYKVLAERNPGQDPKALYDDLDQEHREGLVKDAQRYFRTQSHSLLVENAVLTAGPRVRDWMNPDKIDPNTIPERYRERFKLDPTSFERNLRRAALRELCDAFARLTPEVVQQILNAETDPKYRQGLEGVRKKVQLERALLKASSAAAYYERAVLRAREVGTALSEVSSDFRRIWGSGEYTPDEKYHHMRALVRERLGHTYAGDLQRLEKVSYTEKAKRWAGRLKTRFVNLGGADAIMVLLRTGHETEWDWSAISYQAGIELLLFSRFGGPALAGYGALVEGQYEGVALLTAAYFFPGFGKAYLVYNMTRNGLIIIDIEIGRGLADLVYMGKLPEENDSWWSTVKSFYPPNMARSWVVNRVSEFSHHQPPSILDVCAGDTFRARRLDVFDHWDAKLVATFGDLSGFTDDMVYQLRKKAAFQFFKGVVEDFAAVRGEFSEMAMLPGRRLMKAYLERPEIRDGLARRIAGDYLIGMTDQWLEEFEARAPLMERNAETAAGLLRRCTDGLAVMGADARRFTPLVSGLPDHEELEAEKIRTWLQSRAAEPPTVEIEAPDRILKPGDLVKCTASCHAPYDVFQKPFDYKWSFEGVAGTGESKEPHERLTFLEAWTTAKSTRLTVTVTDATGQEIGEAEHALKFGELVKGETSGLGQFHLLQCTAVYYSAAGKKKGDARDIIEETVCIPVLINSKRTLDQAIEDTRQNMEDWYGKPNPNAGAPVSEAEMWTISASTGRALARFVIKEAAGVFPTPFEPSDVPPKKTEEQKGKGPVL